ncbi:MAG: dihydrofolate reductase [Pseudobdellovibrio sp.]|nr:dihydrofolate reductase [Pseudobdellovibrio sp.]
MILSQIVAIGENFAIGKDNKLLWHFPEDLKYFKTQTSGKIMIMGRKTYDSLGKPLPKRFHIVISRKTQTTEFPNVHFVTTINEAIAFAKTKIGEWPDEVMVVGGAEIYKQTRTLCDLLYVTRIPGQYEGDTFYPADFQDGFALQNRQTSDVHPGLAYEVWENVASKTRKS